MTKHSWFWAWTTKHLTHFDIHFNPEYTLSDKVVPALLKIWGKLGTPGWFEDAIIGPILRLATWESLPEWCISSRVNVVCPSCHCRWYQVGLALFGKERIYNWFFGRCPHCGGKPRGMGTDDLTALILGKALKS